MGPSASGAVQVALCFALAVLVGASAASKAQDRVVHLDPAKFEEARAKANAPSAAPRALRITRVQKPGQNAVRRAPLLRDSPYIAFWPGINGFDGPLSYTGGTVMSATINVYLLFYGSWPSSSTRRVISNFVQSISSTAADAMGNSVRKWWLINTRYPTSSSQNVTTQVNYIYSITFPGPYKTYLADGTGGSSDDVAAIVQYTLGALGVRPKPNDVYVVLTSNDIQVGSPGMGFCGKYCAYHSGTLYSGVLVQYAFVGDPSLKCSTSCSPKIFSQYTASTPNGVAGVDSMVNLLGHELAEAATDPYPFNGFKTSKGNENADLCAWDFIGWKYQSPYLFNVYGINGMQYFLQTLPDFGQQACVLQ